MIHFAEPLMFLLIPLIIPIAFFSFRGSGSISYSNTNLFRNLLNKQKLHPRMLLPVLRMVALALFICAMARPQEGKVISEVKSSGVDILLALDTSGSMQALDFRIDDKPVDRLRIVKNVVSDFVKKRGNDRLGLVVFGEEAFIQCPLTLDHGILTSFLKKLEIGMAGDGTAIGSALGTAINRMKDLKSKEKIVILMTDGRNNSGRLSPSKAADIASRYGIKVYTIGVGTDGKAPFLVDGIFGKNYIYRDVDIDEETLREISDKTSGRYFRATDTEKLEEIYDEIDKLETTEIKMKEYTEYKELFHLLLIPGILILLFEIVLANTKLRKIP